MLGFKSTVSKTLTKHRHRGPRLHTPELEDFDNYSSFVLSAVLQPGSEKSGLLDGFFLESLLTSFLIRDPTKVTPKRHYNGDYRFTPTQGHETLLAFIS